MAAPTPPGVLTGDYWKTAGGQAWVENEALMDRLNRPVGDRVAERVPIRPAARVLDIGCGAGATTLDMARRLGPTGTCVGVDVSDALLELGRQRAREAGVANAEFLTADAQTYDFGAETFDAAISRYGVMFFEDPDAAFENLRRALRPDGVLVFACWRAPEDNPLTLVPLEAAAPFLPELIQPPTDRPGRFAFADPDRVRGILQRSGWREIEIAPLDVPTPLSLDEMLTLSLKLGLVGARLPTLDEPTRNKIEQAVAERFAAHAVDGRIAMSAACWLVEARR